MFVTVETSGELKKSDVMAAMSAGDLKGGTESKPRSKLKNQQNAAVIADLWLQRLSYDSMLGLIKLRTYMS